MGAFQKDYQNSFNIIIGQRKYIEWNELEILVIIYLLHKENNFSKLTLIVLSGS